MSADRDNVPESSSQKPLHVLTLTPFYPCRGTMLKVVLSPSLCRGWTQLGVTQHSSRGAPFYRRGAASGTAIPARWVSFFSFPGGWGLSSAGAFLFASLLPEIRRLHDSHPVDLIHAHSALPCGHAASLLSRELKIPFVVTVHGLDAFSIRQVEGRAGTMVCWDITIGLSLGVPGDLCQRESSRTGDRGRGRASEHNRSVQRGRSPNVFSAGDEAEQ